MSTFRTFAIAAVTILTLVNALDVPASVFSTDDLKGADTRPIKNIYIFGDSYSDNCNGARLELNGIVNALFPFPNCVPAPIGRADNALAWPEYVANYRPDWDIKIYAHSGATCDAKQQNQGSVDIPGQLQLFQTRFKTQVTPAGLTDNPNTAVGVLFIGGNDLLLIQQKAWGKLPLLASSTGSNDDASMCIKKQIDAMHDLGFRRFVLFELPPVDQSETLGGTSDHAASTAALIQRRNTLSAQYSADLVKQWNDGSTISIFPTIKLLTPMVTLNPAYEFKNGQGKYCNLTCPDPYSYAWTDGLHLSFRAFQLMANAFVRFLDPEWKSGAIFSDVIAGQFSDGQVPSIDPQQMGGATPFILSGSLAWTVDACDFVAVCLNMARLATFFGFGKNNHKVTTAITFPVLLPSLGGIIFGLLFGMEILSRTSPRLSRALLPQWKP